MKKNKKAERQESSLVQEIIRATREAQQGGSYSVSNILNKAGVSIATYKRAHASLIHACKVLRQIKPAFARLTLPDLVEQCVAADAWPDFTAFVTGKMPVNSFRRCQRAMTAIALEENQSESQVNDTRLSEATVADEREDETVSLPAKIEAAAGSRKPSKGVKTVIADLVDARPLFQLLDIKTGIADPNDDHR